MSSVDTPLFSDLPALIREDLIGHYSLSADQIGLFQDQGFIKLKQVLAPPTLAFFRAEVERVVTSNAARQKPMDERTTYEKAFLQLMNLWTHQEVIRKLSFSPKMARIAAELMQVKGVRMYHDQALYKEPGGGLTPWHADKYYWPVDRDTMCTAWIPLQATTLDMGALGFSAGSHHFVYGRDLEISDESERALQEALEIQRFPYKVGAFELGEVSFHWGWTFHNAGPNVSDKARAVMTMIYLEDGARLTEPCNRNQKDDWDWWMPGAAVGQPIGTRLNPLLYRQEN